MTNAKEPNFFEFFDDASTHRASANAANSSVAQYLMFVVSKTEMAVALAHVIEIVPYERVSAVPGTPSYVRGVVHARERVIPVIDLASKLGCEPEMVTNRTCILILEHEHGEQRLPMGIAIDGIATLLDVDVTQIRPAPRFGDSLTLKYLEGLLPTERGMLPVIDFQRLFASDELAQVAATVADESRPSNRLDTSERGEDPHESARLAASPRVEAPILNSVDAAEQSSSHRSLAEGEDGE